MDDKSRYKKAKDDLERIRRLRLKISVIESAIERTRHEMENPMGAVSYDRDRVQSSNRGDSLERHVIKYVEQLDRYEKEYIDTKMELAQTVHEAEMMILQLPDVKPKDFLLRHYIDGVSEIDYAAESGYETTLSVYNLRIRAIKLFATLL